MTKNEFKNSAPIAPTSTGAGSAPKTIAPKPEKGTLVKKKNTAAGGATGSTAHRSHVKATGGASYGIKAKMPAHTEPAAGHTQANGKIIPAATKRSAPNFKAGMSEMAR
jgi:hypothetical protein